MKASRTRPGGLWAALPLGVLFGCVILTVFTGDLAPHELRSTIIACVAVGAWHGGWVLARPHWFETRLLPMALYFTGLLVLADFLAELSTTFFPLYLACYPMAFVALPGAWAYAGVGATAALSLFGLPWGSWTLEGVVIELGAVALVSVAGGAIRALEAESSRRRSALAELSAARDQLQLALTENLALQEQLIVEARDSGMLSERSRLAAEIHDTLAAGLAGIVSQLEALDAQFAPEDPLRARVRMSSDLARESLQEARRSIRAMRPGPLITATLPDALETAVAHFENTHPIAVELRITGDIRPVHALVEEVVLRSAGEALTNADRHARAAAVHVTLSFFDTEVALDVADDGIGFDPDAITAGHGLSIMRDRVQELGGRISIESSQTPGTTVTVVVPNVAPHGVPRSVPQ